MGTFEDDESGSYEQELAIKVYKKNALRKQMVAFYDQHGLIQMKTALD